MDFEKEDIFENPDWEYVGTNTDIKSVRTISSRPGFQSLLTLHAGIALAESENKSENILTNEKYTDASVYGETGSADFPSTRRTVCDPLEVHRSRNHHPPIIQERRFKRVQKLKAKRSNIEVDEDSN